MPTSKDSPTRWATALRCSRTAERAPLDEPAFLSPAGAPWLVDYELDETLGRQLREALASRPWSLWRYAELLPLREVDARIDLGEGGTPLVPLHRAASWLPGSADVEFWVKQEAGNPTGSFKDRGLSLAVNRARELGAAGVQLPSAGNAGVSLAAYAAAAGLRARIAVPTDTPATVEQRCREVGAEVLRQGANLVESGAYLARQPDAAEFWNLATLKEPYRAEGKKTMGIEIAEQLGWKLPDWVIYPTGGGTGIVGMAKAFDELERLGLIGPERPHFVAVQMKGCAPIVRAFEQGADAATPWQQPDTEVWGLRVPQAIGDFLILRALRSTDGRALAVAEDRLEEITDRFRRSEGQLLGPEGAAVLLAAEELLARGDIRPGERVVLFQTGHPANY